ncbi:flippase, partial [Klebsiella pneumoniae]
GVLYGVLIFILNNVPYYRYIDDFIKLISISFIGGFVYLGLILGLNPKIIYFFMKKLSRTT